MNSDHIDHEGMMSIPKALKEINADYVTAHYGKWGIGSSELVGYDFSDGPNQNRDGGFGITKLNGIVKSKKILNTYLTFLKKPSIS